MEVGQLDGQLYARWGNHDRGALGRVRLLAGLYPNQLLVGQGVDPLYLLSRGLYISHPDLDDRDLDRGRLSPGELRPQYRDLHAKRDPRDL